MRARRLVLFAALLAACEHSTPFRPGTYGPDGPLSAGPVTRLTFNPGEDLGPVVLPGGGGIFYSAERLDRSDRDHCLAELPPNGGAIRRWVCRTTVADDSINVLDEPAVSGDGRLAYVRASGSLQFGRPLGPSAQQLVLATLAAPEAPTRVLLPIPSPAPGGRVYEAISHIGWLAPSRLVYLEETVRYLRACSSCPPDTVRTGIEIVTLDFAGPTPVLAVVPATDSASSVAVGATGDTIYFTRNGDSRVYRFAFSSGQTDTVFDFGGAGIARDLAYRAGRLVAVVGGDVRYDVDTVLGGSQRDGGGDLQVLDVGSGVATPLARNVGGLMLWYRRPALGPGGRDVVAVGRQFVVDTSFPGFLRIDTLYLTSRDLWQRSLP